MSAEGITTLPHQIHADAVRAAREWTAEQRAIALRKLTSAGEGSLRRRNLRLMALRLQFPPGAFEVCAAVEDDNPDWFAFWFEEIKTAYLQRPACFSATRRLSRARDHTVYAADEAGLRLAIEQAPEPRW